MTSLRESEHDIVAGSAPRLDPWVGRAMGLWVVFAVAVCVKTFVSPDRHTVYPKMAARASSWWSGSPLYVKHEGLGGFPYSPTFAIGLTPFAALGPRFGGTLWSWVSIAVYVWGLRRMLRDVFPSTWPEIAHAGFLALAMIGAIRGIWNAQSNALIIGLLMGGVSAVARQRWWTAAFLLAAPVYLKLWPVAAGLLLAALWPRRLAGRFAAALAVGALLPFLTQPPATVVEQYRGWFAFLRGFATGVDGEHRSYRELWTVIKLTGVPVHASVYRAVQLLTAAVTLGWCLWQQRRAPSTRWLLTVTLAIAAAWMLVFGPSVEYNTYVVLAPMVTWGLLTSLELRLGRVLVAIAFVMTMILGAGAIERLLIGISPAVLAMLPAGTLLFTAWLVGYANRTSVARAHALADKPPVAPCRTH